MQLLQSSFLPRREGLGMEWQQQATKSLEWCVVYLVVALYANLNTPAPIYSCIPFLGFGLIILRPC